MSDKITFFRSYAEALDDIEDAEEYRACMQALLHYAFTGEDVASTPTAKMYLKLVKPTLDKSIRFRDAGQNGGSHSKAIAKPDASLTQASCKPHASLSEASAKPTASHSEAYAKPSASLSEADIGIRNKDIGDRKEIESMSYDIDRRTDVATEDVNQVVEAWNTLPSSVPKVSKIITGSKRDKMLRARIREYGLTPVVLAVEQVRQSDFLCGRNKKGWTISFDWFIGPENFPKVREGNYGARSGTTGAEPMTGRDYLLQMIRGGTDDRDRDEQDPIYDPGKLSEAL